jgi:hypothetical protein
MLLSAEVPLSAAAHSLVCTFEEAIMRRFIPALTAALFSAVTFSAYAVDEPKDNNPPPPQEKQAKKKKPESPTVQQSGNPADQSGQGAAQSSGAGAVQEGSNAPGRGDPTGTTMTPGGAVTSPTPTGPGRADQQ